MVLKLLTTPRDLKLCAGLQKKVWGSDQVLEVADLVALVHAGGMAAGAFVAEALAGFVFGFPSYRPAAPQPNGLHSHLLAVLPEYRGHGLGKALKWFQREWCLARGLPWMTWTFDPLQAKNARLNLEHLGAVARDYRVDEYGALDSALTGTLPTDRLLAFWELGGTEVTRLAQGSPPASPNSVPSLSTLPTVLASDNGRPGAPDTTSVAPTLRVEVPPDFTHLLQNDPATALAWRLAARAVLDTYLKRGYTATRFLDGAYILEKETNI